MKVRTQCALLVSVGLLATSAFADISTNSLYISGAVGYGSLSSPNDYPVDPNSDFITSTSYSTHSFVSGLDLGYRYALTQHILIGSELGWDYNGQAEYTTVYPGNVTQKLTINSYDIHLLATSTYLFNNGLNFFGKAGVARVNQKGVWSNTGFGDWDIAKTQYQPMVAAGIGYQIKRFNVFIQYDHIFGQNANQMSDMFNQQGKFTNTVASNSIKLGLEIKFDIH